MLLWVTNRNRLLSFVKDELLPAWKMRHAATWVRFRVCMRCVLCVCAFISTPLTSLALHSLSMQEHHSQRNPRSLFALWHCLALPWMDIV